MAISYPLTLPSDPGPRDIDWIPVSAVATSRSAFTYLSQTYDWRGKGRRVYIEYPPMTVAQAKAWQAWLMKLNGTAGTFYLSDTVGGAGRGTVAGTPLVKGAGQTDDTLLTDGWTTADNVVAGDWISINNRLYTILDDATEAGGIMTLRIWPDADDPADNAPIRYGAAAKGVFRLSEFPSFAWDVTRLQAPLVLNAVEAKVWGAILEENGDWLQLEDETALTLEM